MGDLTLLFIMAALLLGSSWGAFKLVMTRQGVLVTLLLGIAAALAIYLGVEARARQGWDAIGYFALLLVFVVPVLAGLAIGGVIGLLKRRREA